MQAATAQKKKLAARTKRQPAKEFDPVRFGQILRRARQEHGLTIAEAAELADLAPSMLSRIENGNRNLLLPTASRLCRALGLSLDRAIGLADDVIDFRLARTRAALEALLRDLKV